ncbi:ferredoxin-type protein [Oceanibacterium hippocampi]|uniref:Ferredoxin-type protein NapF n=2 Tax=Oceanibacterium hippocampi TaxID=745714 RepID=A0A1Y5TIC6_9PROT|nr:ferredoxin-type protein [Oceanibacterium hippocampi]
MPDPGRRALLSGRVKPGPAPIRPPWTDEARIAIACDGCAACRDACPEAIIRIGDGGYPVVDFLAGNGACTFCGDCARACPADVFGHIGLPAWSLAVSVDDGKCLPAKGIHCETCRDSCDMQAIRFPPRLGGPPVPIVSSADCSGCGACLSHCPTGALSAAYSRETMSP